MAALAFVLVLAVAAVSPAVAITAQEEQVPDDAAVGSNVEAVYTITELYEDPSWDSWTLELETELEDVTWTVTYYAPGNDQIDQFSRDGQQVTLSDKPIDKSESPTVTKVRVKVQGTAPAVENYTYPDEEQFDVATLRAVREGGSSSELGTWTAHHYTTGEDEAGSQEARQALDDARAAIDNASAAGADVGEAESTLEAAISAYENGNFPNAVNLATDAADQAESARQDVEQSRQTRQLLLFGVAGLVALALIGGIVYWYRSQQDEYDKLG